MAVNGLGSSDGHERFCCKYFRTESFSMIWNVSDGLTTCSDINEHLLVLNRELLLTCVTVAYGKLNAYKSADSTIRVTKITFLPQFFIFLHTLKRKMIIGDLSSLSEAFGHAYFL